MPDGPALRALPSVNAVMALPASDELGGPPAVAAAGWYPDTYKRFEWRYWDGTAWTAHVSTNGSSEIDPSGGVPR